MGLHIKYKYNGTVKNESNEMSNIRDVEILNNNNK